MIVEKLGTIYCPSKGWGLYPEVRSAPGAGVEGIRVADAVAVSLWPSRGLEVRGFEVKVSRNDWLRERKQPDKAETIARFCARWYLVTPAPRKDVITSLDELPEGWGLIEVGTGEPRIIRESTERTAEEPTPAFLQSLLRASFERGASDSAMDTAPLRLITRPALSRFHVGLACGHAAPAPGAKKMPARIPCFSCLEGAPADLEVARAVIADADATTLRLLAAEIEGRRA